MRAVLSLIWVLGADFGCRYVKSTVCRHRGVWRRADEKVQREFEAMGRDEKAVWAEFVRRVEGKAGKGGEQHDEGCEVQTEGMQ